MNHKEYLKTRRFRGLDGLRALAIAAVVWHHSEKALPITLASRGFLGVDLFFVLSGFLICTLLLRERSKTGRISLADFWIRRILRLVPAYYCLLLALVIAYLVLKPGDPDTARLVEGLPAYALYYSNWAKPDAVNLGITWSLATEWRSRRQTAPARRQTTSRRRAGCLWLAC
jgi:peptidoglycan/LPS O-acetylase OafA/YrhL